MVMALIGFGTEFSPAQSLEGEARDENMLESVLTTSDDASDVMIVVDVNQANVEELLSIPGMSQVCAASILAYRKEKGFIHELAEIATVTGMTPEIFSSMRRHVEISEITRFRANVMSYISLSPQRSALYDEAYAEYGIMNFQKLTVAYGNFEAFIVTDKDPGEASYTDFTSFSLSVKKLWFDASLVAGNYSIGLGNGLLFSRSGMLSKSAGAITPLFTSRPYSLRPYRSKGENRFLRGAALDLPFGGIKLTAFGSYKNLAAGVSDSGTVTTVDYSGMNLPGGPARQPLRETIAGGVIRFESEQANLGMSCVRFLYDRAFDGSYLQETTAWESFARLRLDRTSFAGEILLDKVISFSVNAGLDFDDARFAIGLRELGSRILQNYGGALSESYPSNSERGVYFGAGFRPASAVRLGFYYDRFTIISLSGAPDRTGEEIFVDSYVSLPERESSGRGGTFIYCRYKYKTKEDTYLPMLDLPAALSVIAGSKQSGRVDVRHKFSSAFSIRVRAEMNFISTGEKGSMLLFDSGWRFGRAAIDTRVCFYRTDSYASAFYVVEKDLPHVAEFTLLYGDGARLFVLGSWKINGSVTAGIKLSRDIYSRERKIDIGKASKALPGLTDVSLELGYTLG